MPYAELADVNAYASQVPFTTTSKPSDQQVTQFIDDIANEIDSTLSQIYVVPISGMSALQYVKNLNIWGALGMAQEARNTAAVPEAQGIQSVWTKRYRDTLKRLADPTDPLILKDAAKNADFIEKLPSQIVDANTLSYPDDDSNDDVTLGDTRPTMGQVF